MWRAFDVGAVVELLSVPDTVVAAGAGGLHRRVHRARPAATSEHLRRVGPGELVVTTAATLAATAEDGAHLTARLDAAQVAGVAVRLDEGHPLPDDLLASADQLSLPII